MFPVVAEQRQTSAIERQWTSSQQQGFAIKTDIQNDRPLTFKHPSLLEFVVNIIGPQIPHVKLVNFHPQITITNQKSNYIAYLVLKCKLNISM